MKRLLLLTLICGLLAPSCGSNLRSDEDTVVEQQSGKYEGKPQPGPSGAAKTSKRSAEQAQRQAVETRLGLTGELPACPKTFSAGAGKDREEALQRVYGRLVDAAGDSRIEPALEIFGEPGNPAVFVPKRYTIKVSTTLVDVCAHFGPKQDDCLAFILGHELGHFFQSHGDAVMLANKHGIAKPNHARTMVETQADRASGFYGYVAGYDSVGLAGQSLDAVYKCYGVNDSIPGYLPRKERRAVAYDAGLTVLQAIAAFQAGVFLLVLNAYDMSANLLEWVGRSFPSREILNNAAVAMLAEATGIKPQMGAPHWAYPLVVDVESRLAARTVAESLQAGLMPKTGSLGFASKYQLTLAKRAQSLLKKVLDTQPEYVPAAVNLANAAVFLRDRRAERYVEDARDLAKAQSLDAVLADLRILDGILAAREAKKARDPEAGKAQRDAAKAAFEEARKSRPHLAEHNGLVLEGKTAPPQPSSKVSRGLEGEAIGGASPTSLPKFGPEAIRVAVPGAADDAGMQILMSLAKDYEVILVTGERTQELDDNKVRTTQVEYAFVTTADDYKGQTSKGIRLGSSEDEVLAAYGATPARTGTPNGTILTYPRGILFLTDEDKRVTRWSLFAGKREVQEN